MFFRIANERIKASSVTRYKRGGQSYPASNRWYLIMWISGKQRDFSFDSEKELDSYIEYLDKIFKVEIL